LYSLNQIIIIFAAQNKTSTMVNKIVISTNIQKAVSEAVGAIEHDRLFLLTDETTDRLCRPLIAEIPCMKHAQSIVIGATDTHKNLDTLASVWTALSTGGGSRHSLMVNLGGGMVTDLGGFAASTFKRGIPYINIPTTLLSMVDASVGGKTGINFNGLKNEIGVFRTPETVIIDTEFLRTLDHENICSGYAEMLKHGLISSRSQSSPLREELEGGISTLLTFDLDHIDYPLLGQMVGESVAVKEKIVEEDPQEHGIRKALNLGHTVGHAFESWALTRKPVLHGYAVAWGLICELYLSVVKTGFPTETMRQVVRFIKENYGTLPITCDDYPELYELMTHDKKNADGIINFTLLGGIGDIRINQTATQEEIYETLDFFREG
jgi:3-dehydroquinate synthase